MTKRVLGVLAALAMVSGTVAACSSPSAPIAPADSGVKDTGGTDAKTDSKPMPVDSTPPDTAKPEQGTTGKACMSDEECDVLEEGNAFCTNEFYVVGPLNPSPVCVQIDPAGMDVCQPSDDTNIRFCDKGLGLCTKQTGSPAFCEAKCELNKDGTWKQKCTGKNSCNAEAISTEGVLFGTCQGGCQADGDCPTGSKCDPVLQYCVKGCTSDTACKAGWTGAPANWKCNTTRGACEFVWPKKLGDVCGMGDTGGEECACFKGQKATAGYCVSYCQTGGSSMCPTGFSCDNLLRKTDSMGKEVFSFTTVPAGLSGYCLRNCTDGAQCTTDEVCEASAGMTQKTCRPKPAM